MISIMPGSLFIVDEQHFDILKYNLSTNPPPGRGPAVGTLLCCDLDDGDDMLECMFPEHVQKATLLCPPPSALFKEIDGDMDGFISEYMSYLDYDNSVKEFYDKALYENSKTMDIVNDYITVTTQMVNDITDNIETKSDVTNALFNTVIDDIGTLTDICDHLNMRMKFNETFSVKILKEINKFKIVTIIICCILFLIQVFDIYLS